MKRIGFLLLLLLLCTSCYINKNIDSDLYTTIYPSDYIISEAEPLNLYGNVCNVTIYKDAKTKKPLNGRFKIIKYGNIKEYVYLIDGKYDGLCSFYERNRERSIVSYDNGIKHGKSIYYDENEKKITTRIVDFAFGLKEGEEYDYEEKRLIEKRRFKKGILNGKEYLFSKNEKDTLVIFNYQFKPSDSRELAVLGNPSYDRSYDFQGVVEVSSETGNLIDTFYLSVMLINISTESGSCSCNKNSSRGSYLYTDGIFNYIVYDNFQSFPIVKKIDLD